MQTSEVLYRAADLIEKRGWTQGEGWVKELDPPDRPLCLEGGIQAALGIPWAQIMESSFDALWECPAYRAVTDYLESGTRLFQWNDRQPSAAEVIATLRAAAVIEAAKEQQVVDGLAANGVVAAAVGAVSAS